MHKTRYTRRRKPTRRGVVPQRGSITHIQPLQPLYRTPRKRREPPKNSPRRDLHLEKSFSGGLTPFTFQVHHRFSLTHTGRIGKKSRRISRERDVNVLGTRLGRGVTWRVVKCEPHRTLAPRNVCERAACRVGFSALLVSQHGGGYWSLK